MPTYAAVNDENAAAVPMSPRRQAKQRLWRCFQRYSRLMDGGGALRTRRMSLAGFNAALRELQREGTVMSFERGDAELLWEQALSDDCDGVRDSATWTDFSAVLLEHAVPTVSPARTQQPTKAAADEFSPRDAMRPVAAAAGNAQPALSAKAGGFGVPSKKFTGAAAPPGHDGPRAGHTTAPYYAPRDRDESMPNPRGPSQAPPPSTRFRAPSAERAPRDMGAHRAFWDRQREEVIALSAGTSQAVSQAASRRGSAAVSLSGSVAGSAASDLLGVEEVTDFDAPATQRCGPGPHAEWTPPSGGASHRVPAVEVRLRPGAVSPGRTSPSAFDRRAFEQRMNELRADVCAAVSSAQASAHTSGHYADPHRDARSTSMPSGHDIAVAAPSPLRRSVRSDMSAGPAHGGPRGYFQPSSQPSSQPAVSATVQTQHGQSQSWAPSAAVAPGAPRGGHLPMTATAGPAREHSAAPSDAVSSVFSGRPSADGVAGRHSGSHQRSSPPLRPRRSGTPTSSAVCSRASSAAGPRHEPWPHTALEVVVQPAAPKPPVADTTKPSLDVTRELCFVGDAAPAVPQGSPAGLRRRQQRQEEEVTGTQEHYPHAGYSHGFTAAADMDDHMDDQGHFDQPSIGRRSGTAAPLSSRRMPSPTATPCVPTTDDEAHDARRRPAMGRDVALFNDTTDHPDVADDATTTGRPSAALSDAMQQELSPFEHMANPLGHLVHHTHDAHEDFSRTNSAQHAPVFGAVAQDAWGSGQPLPPARQAPPPESPDDLGGSDTGSDQIGMLEEGSHSAIGDHHDVSCAVHPSTTWRPPPPPPPLAEFAMEMEDGPDDHQPSDRVGMANHPVSPVTPGIRPMRRAPPPPLSPQQEQQEQPHHPAVAVPLHRPPLAPADPGAPHAATILSTAVHGPSTDGESTTMDVHDAPAAPALAPLPPSTARASSAASTRSSVGGVAAPPDIAHRRCIVRSPSPAPHAPHSGAVPLIRVAEIKPAAAPGPRCPVMEARSGGHTPRRAAAVPAVPSSRPVTPGRTTPGPAARFVAPTSRPTSPAVGRQTPIVRRPSPTLRPASPRTPAVPHTRATPQR